MRLPPSLLLLLLVCLSAAPALCLNRSAVKRVYLGGAVAHSSSNTGGSRLSEFPLCNGCLWLMEHNLAGNVLEVVISSGIPESCKLLCDAAFHNSSSLEAVACSDICEIAGIFEFAHLMKGADLSAPYICEELQTCPHSSCNATGACVKIHGVDVSPKSGAVGSVFHVVANYSVLNAKIGTGALVLNVDGPLTAGEITYLGTFVEPPVGSYQAKYTVQTKEGEWSPGKYTMDFDVCDQACDNPHGFIYDMSFGKFELE